MKSAVMLLAVGICAADARVLLQGQGQGQVSKTEPSLNNGQIMQLYAANAAQANANDQAASQAQAALLNQQHHELVDLVNALTTTDTAPAPVQAKQAADNAAIIAAAQQQVEEQQALLTAQADAEQKQKDAANKAQQDAEAEAAKKNAAPIPIPQPVPVYVAPVEQPLSLDASVDGKQVQVPQQAAAAVAKANSDAVTLSTTYSASQLNANTQLANSAPAAKTNPGAAKGL